MFNNYILIIFTVICITVIYLLTHKLVKLRRTRKDPKSLQRKTILTVLNEKLKQAKRIKKSKDKLFWRNEMKRQKEEKRILTFVNNEICPECGEKVILKQITDKTCCTDNHYKCTNCSFEKHSYCDDEDTS